MAPHNSKPQRGASLETEYLPDGKVKVSYLVSKNTEVFLLEKSSHSDNSAFYNIHRYVTERENLFSKEDKLEPAVGKLIVFQYLDIQSAQVKASVIHACDLDDPKTAIFSTNVPDFPVMIVPG